MADWACQNPSCKSHGQPHPNCRCPAPMAEGGSPSHYCNMDRQHLQACEYYADGGSVPSFDDPNLKEMPAQSSIPSFDDPALKDVNPNTPAPDQEKYGGLGQQAIAGVEGLAQGFAGPLATVAEKGLDAIGVPGVSNEDIAGRAAANPITHGIAEAAGLGTGLLTGTGEAGLIAKGVGRILPRAAEGAGVLAKLGSAAIKGGIESGLFQTGDEISNAMLGKGDPETPVSSALAHIGAATLFGSVTAGLFNGIGQGGNKALQAIENSKLGDKAKNIMVGFGLGAKVRELGLNPEQAKEYINNALGDAGLKAKDIRPGVVAFDKGMDLIHGKLVKGIADASGAAAAGIPGAIITDQVFHPMAEAILDKVITKGNNRYLMPSIIRAVADGHTNGIFNIGEYANAIAKGDTAIQKGVDALFKSGGQQIINTDKLEIGREKLHKFMEAGGLENQTTNEMNEMNSPTPPSFDDPNLVDPKKYAKGGEVKPQHREINDNQDHIANVFPEQSMILNAAKGRIYNYLNSVRPQPSMNKLPYDNHREDKESKKSYHRALDLANQPLSILNHIKDGSILPEHIKHFTELHPELHKNLSSKIMSKITNQQLDEERPSFKVRQGLSMFLGQPLDSNLTPANIQAAQSAFISKLPEQPPQGPNKTKKGTAPLSKISSNYMTKDQHREERQNKT